MAQIDEQLCKCGHSHLPETPCGCKMHLFTSQDKKKHEACYGVASDRAKDPIDRLGNINLCVTCTCELPGSQALTDRVKLRHQQQLLAEQVRLQVLEDEMKQYGCSTLDELKYLKQAIACSEEEQQAAEKATQKAEMQFQNDLSYAIQISTPHIPDGRKTAFELQQLNYSWSNS